MEDCLRAAGLCDARTVARTIGGEEDIGRDMNPEGRTRLETRLREGAAPFFEEPDLVRNVARRLALYRAAAGARPIRAFVNVGGGWANLGTDAAVLEVEPGLARRVIVPPLARRGVLQAMAADGVPVIHLLNIKGLCDRYGLPWDPRPMPGPDPRGLADLHRRVSAGPRPAGAVLSAAYILAVAAVLGLAVRRRPF
jgi:poly-gamma-glutamate system protein